MVERNCKLAQIGGLLDNKGYGIVMKKSKYTIIFVYNTGSFILVLSLNWLTIDFSRKNSSELLKMVLLLNLVT